MPVRRSVFTIAAILSGLVAAGPVSGALPTAAKAFRGLPDVPPAPALGDGIAAYRAGDYATALKDWRPLAEKGNATAQVSLGFLYSQGQGVPKNYAKAAEWYRRAATRGFAPAQYLLGGLYVQGQGVPRNYVKAAEWYRRAATRGFAPAQTDLGILYQDGHGVPQDYAKAAEWYRRAAVQGNADAQSQLGFLYGQGQGVPRNYVKAAEWWRLAAKQGDAAAQNNLGALYAQGHGVPRNYVKAAEWWRLAAKQGNAKAQTLLGTSYEYGRGVPKDYTQAAEWYRRAAVQGYALAQSALGAMYYLGEGVPRNYVESYKWRNLAAAQGVSQAAKALDALSTLMTPSQIAEAQRLSAAFRPQVAGAPLTPAPPLAGRQPAGDLGSGFFVTASGVAVTNAHVVTGCRQIRVDAGGQAETVHLLATDRANDLALLATGLHPGAVAPLRLTAQQGDAVAVYGFPLPGLLAPGGTITFGNITALAGPADDSSLLQISAPVQPGNSGGPVLDDDGNVVGIVVAKLNALRVAAATADIPQNVNFAIKAAVLADFLTAHGVAFTPGTLSRRLSHPAMAAAARSITIEVVCEK